MNYAEKRRAALEGGAKPVNANSRGVGFVKFDKANDYVQGVYAADFQRKVGRIVKLDFTSIDGVNGEGAAP